VPESTLASVPDSPIAADASCGLYARLLKVLLPSMRGLCLQDEAGRRLWATPDWSLADCRTIADAAIRNAPAAGDFPAAMQLLDEDHAVYAFALPRNEREIYGVVLIALTPGASGAEPRPLKYVLRLLAPLLACWRSELSLRAALAQREPAVVNAGDPADRGERDLARANADADGDTESDAQDEFDRWLDVAMRRAQATFAALCVPERRISRSRTRSGQMLVPAALQRAEQHLLAWLQLQQRTIVVNRIARTASAEAAPYKILATAVRHRSGRVIGVLALFNPPRVEDFAQAAIDAAESVAKRLSAAIEAGHDAATGLLTREAFERCARPVVGGGAPLTAHSVLYVDVDRLQGVNEAFGMHVGDAAIAAVAERLVGTLPADALCARLSGDRFAALMPNTNRQGAVANAERVRAAVAVVGGAGVPQVSVSIGVASLGASDHALAHALVAAESACKSAKARGGNRVETPCDPAGAGHAPAAADAVGAATAILLRRALAADELCLLAQPILPLRGNYGGPRFELLLRLPGERGEMLAPGKFLPVAREQGLLPAIDRWVVRRVCVLLGRHAAAVGGEHACFSINLAAESLQDEAFCAYVAQQLAAERVPLGALGFEIAEPTAVAHADATRRCIDTLRERGCRFALDGFGAGSGSLALLKDLAVDTLKIDGSIVRAALDGSGPASMVKAIAQLATVMCMRTVAEHVETDALRSRISELGVDYAQGFAVARALPIEGLLDELAVFEASVSAWAAPAETAAATASS